ncbi:MAG TPA: hypothetical protein VEB20_09300 [Azospirillaceae bacterium]|nr:hypothetical protein [Azospirillaceae bacterium]
MYRLGCKVRVRGQEGTLIGRVLLGNPSYDVRLNDGTLVKYVPERDLEPVPDQQNGHQQNSRAS